MVSHLSNTIIEIKEVNSVDEVNSLLGMGWKILRTADGGGAFKYSMAFYGPVRETSEDIKNNIA